MHEGEADNLDVYLQFLLEVLQAIADRGGDKQVVYPLLEANKNKLDLNLAKVLQRWAIEKLARSKPEEVEILGGIIGNFSNRILEFHLGNKSSNIEIAITGYKILLNVFTREAFPEQWATVYNSLGIAYCDRILGNKANNIEQSIAALQAALTVTTQENYPFEWAQTHINLGIAYSNRIEGNKANNIEQSIAALQAALTIFTPNDFFVDWARAQSNLGSAYINRIEGNKANNIEQSIAAFQAALSVYTREFFPVDWAIVQNNLGIAYINRIEGNKADNIEQGIAASQAALSIYTREAFPFEWARTQLNLANAYRKRIWENKADNIEQSIVASQAALSVYTREAFPEQWAMAQNNLANAYSNRIQGNKADNIEQSIAASQSALSVYTHKAFPEKWATLQNNLGTAYCNRILGDKAHNIEQSILALQAALSVYTREDFPVDWAMTQNNLGTAYLDRILGDKSNNIEQSITAFQVALNVYTREDFPVDWANVQHNLGIAYLNRRENIEQGMDAFQEALSKNIENSITALQEALKVYTPDAFPIDWAMTKNNLGNAYRNRIQGDKANNIEQSILAFQDALSVYTHEAFPVDWAVTQNNLGGAYIDRIEGDKANNIEQGIAALQAALSIRTREAFPGDWAMTQYNLGIAYYNRIQGDKAENTQLAIAAYKETVDTAEFLREQIISGDKAKQKLAEQWSRAYIGIVECCLKLSKINEALEYAERSKTRNLVELIFNRDSKTIFPPDLIKKLENLRDEIAAGQDEIQNGKAENPQALGQHLQKLRQQRNQLQDQYLQDKNLPVGYSFDFKNFQANLDEETAIIQWYITSAGCETFIITRSDLQRLNTPEQDSLKNELLVYFQEYFTAYFENRNEWKNSLNSRFNSLSQILQVENILNELRPKNCSRLILIPHVFLHLFPLHTLPLTDGELLFEKFSNGVSYAPSCQILQQIQQRKAPNFESIFAIQNPTKDLAYANLEVEQILPLFSSSKVLSKSQATKDELYQAAPNLKEVNYLHFACHGYFNPISPTNSCLLLADAYVSSVPVDADHEKYLKISNTKNVDLSKCLSLGNLFDGVFNLNQCRLVILSACETGLIDFNNMSDEYIGLPSGFLYAGSSCVVSSLWTVDDKSTAYLMMKFLQNLRDAFNSGQDISVAVALNQAQKWLRDITWEDLKEWKKSLPPEIAKTHEAIKENREVRRRIDPQSEIFDPNKPYASPFYWAAFTAIGN